MIVLHFFGSLCTLIVLHVLISTYLILITDGVYTTMSDTPIQCLDFSLHVYFRLYTYPSFLLNANVSFNILALLYQRKSTWSGRPTLLGIRIVITWQPHSQVPIPEFTNFCRTQKFYNLRGTTEIENSNTVRVWNLRKIFPFKNTSDFGRTMFVS